MLDLCIVTISEQTDWLNTHLSLSCMPRTCTVKILINARAFIRIITFHGEAGGRLLEAMVFERDQNIAAKL